MVGRRAGPLTEVANSIPSTLSWDQLYIVDGPRELISMGQQHNTHVANGFGESVTVVVTHPDYRNDKMVIANGEVRNVATAHGEVGSHIMPS